MAELADIVGAVFPDTVAAAVVTLDDEPPCPYAAELDLVAGASSLRRREFLAGRACAHAALRDIGRPTSPVSG